MRHNVKAAVAIVGTGAAVIAGLVYIAPDGVRATGVEPETLKLNAVVRDFRSAEETNGHPDFQAFSGTTRVGLVEDELGEDGRPVLRSRMGSKIISEYQDADGNPINPAMYTPSLGDVEGELEEQSDIRITSEQSFSSWYRDVPGINQSKAIVLTLNRDSVSGAYVFDSDVDPTYSAIGGFFPIDDQLYGNYASYEHNYHFTTEVRTEFTYRRNAGYTFAFTGDDDVWVFIDGRLVIDLGSLHPRKEQVLDLDRLDWLDDGKVYTLDVFHAERRTTQSNFRMETTIPLESTAYPSVTTMFD